MGEGGADAAAVEVDDVLALTQREDDALVKKASESRFPLSSPTCLSRSKNDPVP